jgi:hypothetical protein
MRKLLSSLLWLALVWPAVAQTVAKGPTVAVGPTKQTFAVNSGTVPSVVQKCPAAGIVHTGTGTTVAIVCGSNTAAGNALIVFASSDVTGSTLTISDTAGNTGNYVQLYGSSSIATNLSGNVWYVCNGAGGADTITITGTVSSVDNYGGALEVHNMASSGCLDQSAAFTSGLTSSSITTTVSNEILIAFLAGGNGGTAPAAPSGYTLIGATNAGGNNPGWAYDIVSATGGYSAAFTAATGTVFSAIASFQ